MKIKSILWVGAGLLFITCSHPQKQSLGDDIVWKASITYCVGYGKTGTYYTKNDEPESDAQENELKVYGYWQSQQLGSLKDVISLLYDSISKGIRLDSSRQSFLLQMDTEYMPSLAIEQDLIYFESTFGDAGFNKGAKIILDSSVDKSSCINGIMLNREWIYDEKEHKLSNQCTDAVLLHNSSQNYSVAYGAYQFCERSNPFLSIEQKVCRPEVVWCENIPLPLVADSGKAPDILVCKTWNKEAKQLEYPDIAVENKHYSPFYGFNEPVKETFNTPLPQWMWIEARKGAVDCYWDDSGKIGKKTTFRKVVDTNIWVDTIVEEDGGIHSVKCVIDSSNLDGLEIKEEISFNKRTFQFDSKISYVGLLAPVANKNTGMLAGDHRILCWIKFNE